MFRTLRPLYFIPSLIFLIFILFLLRICLFFVFRIDFFGVAVLAYNTDGSCALVQHQCCGAVSSGSTPQCRNTSQLLLSKLQISAYHKKLVLFLCSSVGFVFSANCSRRQCQKRETCDGTAVQDPCDPKNGRCAYYA